MRSILSCKLCRHVISLMGFCTLSLATASVSSPKQNSNIVMAQLRAGRGEEHNGLTDTLFGDGKFLIVPGQSSGIIRLGMPQSKVRSILGRPAATIKLKDGSVEDYWADRSKMHADAIYRAGYCIQIEVMDPNLKSRDGISTGTSIRTFFLNYSNATMAEYGYDLDAKAVDGEAPGLAYVTPGEVNIYFYDAIRGGVAVEIGTQDEFTPDDKPEGVIVHRPGHPLIIPTYGVFNHAPHRTRNEDDHLTPAYLYAHASTN